MIICEVVQMHINEAVLDENGMIDQHKIDLVSRMGGNWYCRADEKSMFETLSQLRRVALVTINCLRTSKQVLY